VGGACSLRGGNLEMQTKFKLQKRKGSTALQPILMKRDMKMWTGLSIGTRVGLL
jgi:hypothetical protein